MEHRGSQRSFALVAAALIIGASAPALARPAVLLLSEGRSKPIADETLLHALSVQLMPYNISCELRRWMPAADRARLAERVGREAGAVAVVWYDLRQRRRRALRVRLQILGELDQSKPRRRSLALGRVRPGIERSMAVSARTLLRATLLRVQRRRPQAARSATPARPAAPAATSPPARAAPAPTTPAAAVAKPSPASPGPARPEPPALGRARREPSAPARPERRVARRAKPDSSRSVQPPKERVADGADAEMRRALALDPRRLSLGVAYAGELYAQGGDLGHGPSLSLGLRLARFEGRIGIGYRFFGSGEIADAAWTAHGIRGVLDLRWRWALARRLALLAGLEATLAGVRVAAESTTAGVSPDSARDTVWQVGVGANLGGRLVLGPRLALEIAASLLGFPIAHELAVRGALASAPGRFCLVITMGALAWVW